MTHSAPYSSLTTTAFKSLLITKLLIFLPYVSFVPFPSALFSFPSLTNDRGRWMFSPYNIKCHEVGVLVNWH